MEIFANYLFSSMYIPLILFCPWCFTLTVLYKHYCSHMSQINSVFFLDIPVANLNCFKISVQIKLHDLVTITCNG
jgi:hypothetical protein